MEADVDVRVIQLIRKTIREQRDMNVRGKTGQNDYFATDYFDVMKVEKKELSAPLTSIMGIWTDEKIDNDDIAAQSLSLYCSTEMMEAESGIERYKDPFESDDENNMLFLSIIQVHITPEVIARALTKESAEKFIDAVYKDLCTTVHEYIDANQDKSFVFRIYKMLSAGDFAVVVRSVEAETSFEISSLLRRRYMTIACDKKIVLYKTYTFLSFGNEIIEQEDQVQTGNDIPDRFVLRCCYSNLYWSNKEKVDEYLEKEEILKGVQIYGLNGRYDFSVRVTQKDFMELLHDIKNYKETGILYVKAGKESESGIVKYMRYLMENRYLSYINERYLVAREKYDNKPESFLGNHESKTVVVTEDKKKQEVFLDVKIDRFYKEVQEKYWGIEQKVSAIKVYRKNMKYYMTLLNKLIRLCRGISGSSDTCIYAAALLEQLDVILDSIDVYTSMYHSSCSSVEKSTGEEKEEEQKEILRLLEEYVRESVYALNGYAQYIRNHNLQSLQTPNYNIESGMSMEKILIGYSEFLKEFMNFYQNDEEDTDKNTDEKCQYLPILVPALEKEDVSVENLFAKGMMNDWKSEKGLREKINGGLDRSCIVVNVPTLRELGDVRTMVTSLIHEMAHQFRYESREERNDALLQYLVHELMRDVVNAVVQKIQKDTGLRDWNFDFGRSLEAVLVNAYMEINYKNQNNDLEYSFREVPLNNFRYCLKKDLYHTMGSWERKNDIRSVFRAFLQKVMYYYDPEDTQCSDAVQILDEWVGEVEGKKEGEGTPDESNSIAPYEKIVKCAYGLSWECARRAGNSTVIDHIWGNGSVKEWAEDGEEIAYEKKWYNSFGTLGSDKTIDNILDNFSYFANWIYDNCGNDDKAKVYNSSKKTEFMQKAYQKMCEKWNGKEIQKALISDYDSILSSIGRRLGIDCNTEGNYKIFEEQMTFVIRQNLQDLDALLEWRIGKYREETADMFMCNVMDLEPFGYMYLLAVGWLSNQELPNEYYNRSQNLLLFQWCLDQENQLSYDKYKEKCVELVRTLESAIDQTVSRFSSLTGSLEKRKASDHEATWNNEEETIELLDRINALTDYCENAEEKMIARQDDSSTDPSIMEGRKILRFYGIMSRMMGQLVICGKAQIEYLKDFEEIEGDYIKGIRKLKGLNGRMRKKKDLTVCRAGEFCKEISTWQNAPFLLMGNAEENEKMNACSIEFLLNMYYENIRRAARQIGEKECL